MELVVPARLEEEQLELLGETVGRAFRALGCEGYSRVDTFVEDDRVLINEINSSPGFTQTSVFASLFAADGRTYPEVLDELLAAALARAEREAKYSF
jgi:D-alanine-D-alanine ligase